MLVSGKNFIFKTWEERVVESVGFSLLKQSSIYTVIKYCKYTQDKMLRHSEKTVPLLRAEPSTALSFSGMSINATKGEPNSVLE